MKVRGVLLMVSVLAGCGQTGDLHLPKDAPSKENYLFGRTSPKLSPKLGTPAPSAPATQPALGDTTLPEAQLTSSSPADKAPSRVP